MSSVFIKLLNLSFSAGFLILAVIVMRAVLKRAPKWFPCVLWAMVGIRLICPFSFESVTSVIPSSEPIPVQIASMEKPQVKSGIAYVDQMINPVIENAAPTQKSTVTVRPDARNSGGITMQDIVFIATLVWIAGMVLISGYALISAWRMRRKVAASICREKGIYICDDIETPFILGMFRPKIYVPSSLDEKTLPYVLEHEKAHLKRLDHLWKPLGFLLLSVYWFNPLCWLSYILFSRDIEMACDERVIRRMEKPRAAAYSQALLDCSIRKSVWVAYPLAFGEVGVRQRVKNVLHYKRPTVAAVALLMVTCVAISGCFLTSPKKDAVNEVVNTDKHAVQVSKDAEYAFDGYSVKVEKVNFSGSKLHVEYTLKYDKDPDMNTTMGFSVYAEGRGKFGNKGVYGRLMPTSDIGTVLEKSKKSTLMSFDATCYAPMEHISLYFKDSKKNTEYMYEIDKPEDTYSFYLEPGKDFEFVCDDERLIILGISGTGDLVTVAYRYNVPEEEQGHLYAFFDGFLCKDGEGYKKLVDLVNSNHLIDQSMELYDNADMSIAEVKELYYRDPENACECVYDFEIGINDMDPHEVERIIRSGVKVDTNCVI
ncbi:MAG: hypothetical protein IKM88_07490 [Lachnospiraceae bacterium]|nr:hypothetical protein [Clostridiales bacterium]MBR6850057.1 hypothetical protein [Lachnospiraceae bacterium]